MTETRSYHGLSFEIAAAQSDKICYLLLPEELDSSASESLEKIAAEYGVNIVAISGMEWDKDMIPWASSVPFRKNLPLSGSAQFFLRTLCDDHIPFAESVLKIQKPVRILAGVSLSGLFAVWAAHVTNIFDSIISISGSLWYPDFVDWTMKNEVSPAVNHMYLAVGDKEKKTRDSLFCTVQLCTETIIERLKCHCDDVQYVLEKDTTHTSPLLPRLSKAFKALSLPVQEPAAEASEANPSETPAE